MRSIVRRMSAFAAVAMLAACAGMSRAPSATGSAAGDGIAAGTPPPGATREVARLVNEHRARIGCPALAWDDAAARAAQAHSEDMARRNFFSHVSPDGHDLTFRLRAQGIAYSSAAENIAFGQPTAQAVVSSWLSSPGHRANIENCALTRQGGGVAGNRWTHVFYTPVR